MPANISTPRVRLMPSHRSKLHQTESVDELRRVAHEVLDWFNANGLTEVFETCATMIRARKMKIGVSVSMYQSLIGTRRMNVGDFVRHWPYCYHVTFSVNLGLIQRSRALYSAKAILLAAGEDGDRARRTADTVIRVWGHDVVLRNQRALNPHALDLPLGCTLDDYVAFLNKRVYFWPGTSVGPVADGMRLLARSLSPPSAIVRVQSKFLLEANTDDAMFVATCNTGASWVDDNGKSQRALDVFRPLREYSSDPRAIVEVSFMTFSILPECSEYLSTSMGLGGPPPCAQNPMMIV